MRVKKHEKFENVYWVEFDDGTRKLATVNLAPGMKVYDERLVRVEGTEYRLWDPYRSKLAAALLRGIKGMPITPGSKVLYLGAASGTTASHVSDIVGSEGMVYCVEISSRPLRDLLVVCDQRPNMVPILADATQLDSYRTVVEQADVVYQDIAQPEQADILLENSRVFLREGCYAILALKARSIDVTKEPREIFRGEIERLEKEVEVVDMKTLDPYAKDHAMLLLGK
ncbi:MAG: fibrillarin-like rRNA/tRNA 2'-O-methyltransferase [Candidatus Hadarchaeota archaeon]|nr:fibrillarin-like rRNA/tRNA 2'-O-methyltransferase [Candidatus Hadarchaeota archaeon]